MRASYWMKKIKRPPIVDTVLFVNNLRVTRAMVIDLFSCGPPVYTPSTPNDLIQFYPDTESKTVLNRIPTAVRRRPSLLMTDTAIMTCDEDRPSATDRLQWSINSVSDWSERRKIKINNEKSVHVHYTLLITGYKPVLLDQQIVTRSDSVKHLGMHPDSRLDWKHRVRQKKKKTKNRQIKKEMPYWLVGRHSGLDITIKTSIVRNDSQTDTGLWKTTVGMYQLVRCRDNIQPNQNIALRTFVTAYRYDENDIVHRDCPYDDHL